MDQMKIGAFISEMRKSKQFTQRQLADLLSISDKTVSKWECGKGLPEVSLMLPLCGALGITVNELLSGERISEGNYQRKAEETMIRLMKEQEQNRRTYVIAEAAGISSLAAFLTLLVVVFYTDVIAVPVKIALIAVACLVLTCGLMTVTYVDCKVGYYHCDHCGKDFVPGYAAYFLGFHTVRYRFLRCPDCGKHSYCKKVMAREKVE